jgi:NEDD8-activating enzyme E1
MKLLLLGVGGVGSEFLILLKEFLGSNETLNVSKFELIIIDDDIVEESNLSRQRLYTSNDIGRPKVEAAAANFNGVLTPLKATLQSIKDLEFFEQFDIFVLAVDNLETRRLMNSIVFQLSHENWLLLDLGVQGFKFSIRSVTNSLGSACLECTLPLYLKEEETDEIAVCSVYGHSRDLKDCVYWSLTRVNDGNDVKEIYDLTKKRASQFSINTTDLSYSFIKNLVTRSIPAVASVNSILAAKGLEIIFNRKEVKVISNNFWMTNLENGYYEFEALLEPDENCIICNNKDRDQD